MTRGQVERARQELRRRRAALVEAARGAVAEADGLQAEDRGAEQEEAAQAEQGLAELGALAQAEREELRRIEAALTRIDEGLYGRCAACDGPIEPQRLVALPWAVRCAPCAEAQERLTRGERR